MIRSVRNFFDTPAFLRRPILEGVRRPTPANPYINTQPVDSGPSSPSFRTRAGMFSLRA